MKISSLVLVVPVDELMESCLTWEVLQEYEKKHSYRNKLRMMVGIRSASQALHRLNYSNVTQKPVVYFERFIPPSLDLIHCLLNQSSCLREGR